MIQLRQCLFHVTLKRSLLFFVFFTSLCTGAYAQTNPDCQDVAEVAIIADNGELVLDGTEFIDNATAMAVNTAILSAVDGNGDPVGTIDGGTGNLTLTCAEIGGPYTIEIQQTGFDPCTQELTSVIDGAGPTIATGDCSSFETALGDDGSDNGVSENSINNDPGECFATVTFDIPTAQDNCSDAANITAAIVVELNGTAVSGFPQATTPGATGVSIQLPVIDDNGANGTGAGYTVEITFTDDAATPNTRTVCMIADVDVVDNEDPAFSFNPETGEPASGYILEAEADDVVIGDNTLICIAAYQSGDTPNLVPTAVDNCSAERGVSLTFAASPAIFNSAGDEITTGATIDFVNGVYFKEGTTTIVWTLQDDAGNNSTTAATLEYDVVVNDVTAPVVACPATPPTYTFATVAEDGVDMACAKRLTAQDSRDILTPLLGGDHDGDGGDPEPTDPLPSMVSDNCETPDGIILTVSFVPGATDATPDLGADGYEIITLNGGMADANINGLAYMDAGDDGVNDMVGDIFTEFPEGETLLLLTFDDQNSTSDNKTCSVIVNIIDGQKPTIDCPTNAQTLAADEDGCRYTVVDDILDVTSLAMDDCDTDLTFTYTVATGGTVIETRSGTSSEPGGTLQGYVFPDAASYAINVTVTDDAGNVSDVCEFVVQVVDQSSPLPGDTFYPTDDLPLALDDNDAEIPATQGIQVIIETTTDATGCAVTDLTDIIPTDFMDNCDDAPTVFYQIYDGPNQIALVDATDPAPISDLSSFTFAPTFRMMGGSMISAPYTIKYSLEDDEGRSTDERDEDPLAMTIQLIVVDKTAPVVAFKNAVTFNLSDEDDYADDGDDGIVSMDASRLLDFSVFDDPLTTETDESEDEAETFANANETCSATGTLTEDPATSDPVADNCMNVVAYYSIIPPDLAADPQITAIPPDCDAYKTLEDYNCEDIGTENVMVTVSDFAYDVDRTTGEAVFSPNTVSDMVAVTIADVTDPMIACATGAANPDAVGDYEFNLTDDADNTCELEVVLELPMYSDNTNDNVDANDDDIADPNECPITLSFSTVTPPLEGELADTDFDDIDPADTDLTLTLPAGKTTVITYRVEDESGNTADCSFDVVINDMVAPTFTTCPGSESGGTVTRATNEAVVVDENGARTTPCLYTYTGTGLVPNVKDNCPVTVTRTLTISTADGTVTNPNSDPANQEIDTDDDDSSGDGNADDLDLLTDNTFINGLDFTVGTYEFTWMAEDPDGNTATLCTYTLVVEDQMAPVIDCSALTQVDVKTNLGATMACAATISPSDYEDNVNVIFGLDADPVADPPVEEIIAALSDNCALNSEITVTATFILGDEDPMPAVDPLDPPTNQISETATGALPNITEDGIGVDDGNGSDYNFPEGSTTIYLSFSDGTNSTDPLTCSFVIDVTDGVAPVFTCSADTPKFVDPGTCTYTATGGEFDVDLADINDDCSEAAAVTLSYSVLNPDGSTTPAEGEDPLTTLDGFKFELEVSQVTIIAMDEAKNPSIPCQFTVSVSDNINPTATAPADQDNDTDNGIQIGLVTTGTDEDACVAAASAFTPIVAMDNCPNPVGTYQVDTDGNGIDAGDPTFTETEFLAEEFLLSDSPIAVQFTVEDATGNDIETPIDFELVILDETAPMITTCPATQTVTLDGSGMGSLTAADLGLVAEDVTDCNGLGAPYFLIMVEGVETQSPTMDFDCSQVAGSPIDVTIYIADQATDINGDAAPNATSCMFMVNVVDDMAPNIDNIVCPAEDPTVNTSAFPDCVAVYDLPVPSGAVDNCADNLVYSYQVDDQSTPDDDAGEFTAFEDGITVTISDLAIGTYVITYNVSDGTNEVQACQFTLTVEDNTEVVLTNATPADGEDFTFDAGDDCTVTLTAADINPASVNATCNDGTTTITYDIDATDDIDPQSFEDFIANTMFEIVDGGTTVTVAATVDYDDPDLTDFADEATFVITVEDNTPPVLICVEDYELALDENGMISIAPSDLFVSATDNCFDGTFMPYFKVDDGAGGMMNSMDAMEFTCANLDNPVTLTIYVNDSATGEPNESIGCPVMVTIIDNAPPTLTSTCPGDETIEATDKSDNDNCVATYTLTRPTAEDNCDLVYTYTVNGGAPQTFSTATADVTLNLGSNDIEYIVTDNSTDPVVLCTFEVTVVDTEVPVITCPSPASGTAFMFDNDASGECVYTIKDGNIAPATATETCNSGEVVITYDVNGTLGNTADDVSTLVDQEFTAGETTTVTAIATYIGGSTTCSFDITVADVTPPALANCPDPVTVLTSSNTSSACSAEVILDAPTAIDACDGTVTVTSDGPADNIFDVGETIVTYTATDMADNSATCSVTVTVVDDENPIVTSCTQNITLPAEDDNCSRVVNFNPPTFSDNCSFLVSRTDGNPTLASGSVYDVGPTTLTYVATDPAGNTATCSFTITIEDTQAPDLTCPADINRNIDPMQCSAVVMFDDPVPTDNCGDIATFMRVGDNLELESGDAFPKGTTTISYMATDVNDNTSVCSFDINVTDGNPSVLNLIANTNSISEGDSGTPSVTFTVRRTNPNCPASVEYITSDGTATAGEDYVAANGTVEFLATETEKTFTITINGDTDVEEDETFVIDLINPSGANIGLGQRTFTILNDDQALSVNWLSFTATANKDEQVELDWEVAEEFNTSHFVVERSTDGQNFEEIGQAVATKALSYTFTDAKPLYGLNYYRLREVANDGSIDFSETASVSLKTAIDFALYPNPTTGVVRIEAGNVAFDKVLVLDALGKTVMAKTADGINEVDLSTLVPGLYFLQIEVDGEYYQQRVIKE